MGTGVKGRAKGSIGELSFNDDLVETFSKNLSRFHFYKSRK